MDPRVDPLICFGTAEPDPIRVPLSAGALSVEFVAAVPRSLRWHGIELVRAVDCLVRDEDWGTYAAEGAAEEVSAGAGRFEFVRTFGIAGGAVSGRVVYRGDAEGRFTAESELRAHRDFSTNRAGLVVLHPSALAGLPVTVARPDRSRAETHFPRRISPAQPIFEIAGLEYSTQGVAVAIAFEGETFEMEDQRNWTDASFKTYGRPLGRPYPYRVAAGEILRQRIALRCSGSAARATQVAPTGSAARTAQAAHGAATDSEIAWSRSIPQEKMPAVALALDGAALPTAAEWAALRSTGCAIARLRLTPGSLDFLAAWAGRAGLHDLRLDLEVVVPAGCPIDRHLRELAEQVAQARLEPGRVMALPEAYLRSLQPTDPRPAGSTPQEAIAAARRAFPQAQIGGGALTHFTEFNRSRPDPAICDYVTHGTSAILHAADDRSVLESLEGLREVFASARAIAGSTPYHLGLVSIGLRTNPHGAAVAANPRQVRLAAAGADPRQRGLFAAAWAVGAMAATSGHAVDSVSLAAGIGPLGLLYRRAVWPQPLYDDRTDLALFPIFHVVRALAQMDSAPRLDLAGLPPGVAGVAVQAEAEVRLILANLSSEPRTFHLAKGGQVRCLDRDSFLQAGSDPDWLDESPAQSESAVRLGPFSVAFVRLPAARPLP